jgi:hypothetical protein
VCTPTPRICVCVVLKGKPWLVGGRSWSYSGMSQPRWVVQVELSVDPRHTDNTNSHSQPRGLLSSGAFVDLPPLSRGEIHGAAAIEVDESDSAAGEVLLLGGEDADSILSTVHSVGVHLVDLATGACAQQPDLLHLRAYHAAARLSDGRIICAGGCDASGVGAAGAGRGGRNVDLEGAPRDEYWALRLLRMRDERRPLRRPRWRALHSWSHVVVRGAVIRRRCALGASAAHARRAGLLRMRGCCRVRHRRRWVWSYIS